MATVQDTRSLLQRTLADLQMYTDELEQGVAGYAATADQSATAAANTAVTVTLAAPEAENQWALAMIAWSYSEAPVAGQITVAVEGVDTVFDLDLGTSAGPGMYQFSPPLLCGDATEVTVTLGAGGGTAVGKLNVHAGEV